MKELEVYVRSYTLGKTGMQWCKIENGESILGYPQILEPRIIPKQTGGLGTIEYLINYQNFSLVLMRYSQQLLFMVAGIEALEERSNQLGRTIYNAVAWVVNPDESNSISPENELMLRHLAARALLSFVGKDPEFINTINEAINFKGLEEFEVNLNKINQLTENSADKLKQLLSNLDEAEADQQIWYKKVEKIGNEQEIISLAEKIIKTGLPEDDLAILISKGDENAVSVSPIDINPEIPKVNPIQKDPDSTPITKNENPPSQEGSVTTKKSKKIKILLMSLILLIMTVLVVVLLNQNQPQPQPQPQPQTQPQTNHPIQ
ncbi:hypothetical protein [Planktothrix agardhii]|jgi:hypothetical protein|uniref:hypothetical protein n=1 Tax=Planktothrix agardhii TaxID=1160 RepID=UPI0037846D76